MLVSKWRVGSHETVSSPSPRFPACRTTTTASTQILKYPPTQTASTPRYQTVSRNRRLATNPRSLKIQTRNTVITSQEGGPGVPMKIGFVRHRILFERHQLVARRILLRVRWVQRRSLLLRSWQGGRESEGPGVRASYTRVQHKYLVEVYSLFSYIHNGVSLINTGNYPF